jgi:hypothetical protein
MLDKNNKKPEDNTIKFPNTGGFFMKKVALIAILAIAALVMMGCPSVKLPLQVTENPVGSKTGQASGQIILGLFGNVDAGAGTAAKNAGITKIATVDLEVKTLLGVLVVTYTTTVTGE